MITRFTKTFFKQLRKLSPEKRVRVDEAITLFRHNPFSAVLRNHKLVGMQKNLRSISAGYDLRLLYSEKDGHALVLFIDVGTHEEVYR